MAYTAAMFEVTACNCCGYAFTGKKTLFALYPLHHVTCAPANFTLHFATVSEEMHFKKIFLDLGAKVKQYVAQYPLHHVTHAPTTFEVASSSGLGRNAFTIKYII